MQLVPGQVVATKLRLVRQLGAGGMGSVWVADHLTLRTQVAVKFMAAELAGNMEALARFSREAASAARIKSPHVVRVFDFGVWEKTPYMVLELLDGEDLASRLRRGGSLDPALAAEIVEQVSRALEEAHAQGIVHRDVKPANIFLTASGGEVFVKLLDFGVAKASGLELSMKTDTGAALGTPFYMGPEQIFARGPISAAADVWSLAVVAYECLTADVPFRGDTLAALGVSIHSGVFRAPSSYGRLSSTALDEWFARALAPDPAARFGSARELADTFRGVAATVAAPQGASTAPSFALSNLMGPTLLAATAPAPGRSQPARVAPMVAGALAAVILGTIGLAAWRHAGPDAGRPADPGVSIAALPSAAPTTATGAEGPASASPSVVASEEPSVAPTPAVDPAASAAPPTGSAAAAASHRAIPGRPTRPRRRDHGF